MDHSPIHGEESFKTQDGLSLFVQWWLPESGTKAAVVIVHGYAEHSSRYAQVAGTLTQNGYAVYSFDLRGHGRSEGERVFADIFAKHFLDIEDVLAGVRKKEGARKIFLLGHSLGGTIVTLFAISRRPNIAGLILSAPYLKFPSNIWPLRFKFVRFISSIIPGFPVTEKINGHFISNDPQLIDNYETDPLIYHRPIQAQEALEIMRAVETVQARMKELILQFIILQGALDKLVNIKGSRELYAQAVSQDKTLKIYPGLYHELLNDPKNDILIADLVKWLDSHIIL